MTMRFLRDAAVSELYAASDDGQPPPAGTTVRWFLLPRGSSAAADLSLEETFALTGTFIFLETPLPAGGEQTFAGAAWTFLEDPSFRNPRIAWFPSGVPFDSQLSGYVLTTPLSNPAVTGRTLVVTYQNYALVVDNGTPFGLDASVPAFTLTQTSQAVQKGIGLTTEFGATSLAGTGSVAIPLTGADAGSFQFPLKLDQTGGVSDLTHLDVGLRTYYATPADPAESGDDSATGGDGTLVTSLRYPVFNEAETFTLNASLAPWSVDETRSYFRFPAGGAPAVLRSCYSTVTGFNLSLTPFTDASGPSATPAQLVFAKSPAALPPSTDDLLTLVPKGDFALAAPSRAAATVDEAIIAGAVPAIIPTSPNSRLMCGLSGVEYIGLNSGANAMSFFTGNPAYAEGFDPSQSAPTNLTDDATTAWAFPSIPATDAAPLTYYAQPDQAVLFQSSGGTTSAQPADNDPFRPLVYFEVPSDSLPLKPSANTAIPLFPYSGVTVDDPHELTAYSTLETQVLSPTRRGRIAKLGGVPPSASVHPQFSALLDPADNLTGVTPQGVLTTFKDTTLQTIAELVLAEMSDQSHFSLFNLPHGAPLRTAIYSNQLFMIATNPKAVAPFLNQDPQKNIIEIEGWTFNVDTSVWTTTGPPDLLGTALIIKFAAGTLVDLVKNPSAWAKADNASSAAPPFNLDDQATSIRISQLLKHAIEAYNDGNGDTDFATFVEAITDDEWQGILILNAGSKLTELPDQCKGLAAGIDPKLFYAHHVGINVAKIVTSTPVSIEPSSMFAMIHYEAPNIPVVPNGASYQFQVDSLRVLFKNSAIAAFSSKIELLISALFGDTVDLAPALRVLELYGVFQHQTIAGKVHDTYLFQTAQNAPKVFPLAKGSVFEQIQIASAQFVTQLDSSDGLTHTYFALAGLLDFADLEGLDLFSFGGETTANVQGLAYNKLLVHMVFDPAMQSSSVFAFDANGIAFDTSNSTARLNSLYQHFPITLTSLIQADSVSSPGGMGYLGVQSPLTQSALVYPWYGLTFDLDLGSLGALAAKAGFVASLLAAWSPSSGTPKIFLGLKLPGSDGGKGTISIEGVLNLGFRAIVLGRNGDSTYYLLLNALALKFLSLTFPPGGQIDMALFGNPADEHNSSLGWYAAYTKDQAQQSGGAKDRAAHAALRSKGVPPLALPPERVL
jgi:hypothetical protein